ncbi:MAG: hypothetical protein IIA91_05370 [Chloroflexi bacterium]|nr:hypothetical protein [Chloroflexota bacterium]
MSNNMRALIIGLAGPALSALGTLWVLANVLIDSGRELTFRYVIFDPGHLVIAAGVMISVVSIPVAFQVAAATPEDLELDLFEPDPAEQPSEAPADIPAEWETAE